MSKSAALATPDILLLEATEATQNKLCCGLTIYFLMPRF